MQDYEIISQGDQYVILILNNNAQLPLNVPVGSVALKADLSVIKMFDGTNWVDWE